MHACACVLFDFHDNLTSSYRFGVPKIYTHNIYNRFITLYIIEICVRLIYRYTHTHTYRERSKVTCQTVTLPIKSAVQESNEKLPFRDHPSL